MSFNLTSREPQYFFGVFFLGIFLKMCLNILGFDKADTNIIVYIISSLFLFFVLRGMLIRRRINKSLAFLSVITPIGLLLGIYLLVSSRRR